ASSSARANSILRRLWPPTSSGRDTPMLVSLSPDEPVYLPFDCSKSSVGLGLNPACRKRARARSISRRTAAISPLALRARRIRSFDEAPWSGSKYGACIVFTDRTCAGANDHGPNKKTTSNAMIGRCCENHFIVLLPSSRRGCGQNNVRQVSRTQTSAKAVTKRLDYNL